MNSQPTSQRALSLSSRIYALLIQAYPREFREEYGPRMLQVFRDVTRQRLRDSHGMGLFFWWVVTLIDLVGSVVRQHLGKESHMIVPGYVRAAGWGLVFGALAFLGFFVALALIRNPDNDPRWYLAVGFLLIGTILVAVGTLVLRGQFGSIVGPGGRAVLLFGVLSSVLLLTGSSEIVWDRGMPLSALPALGPALLLGSLGGFGLLSFRTRAVPASLAWNLIAAFWLLLLVLAGIAAYYLGRPIEIDDGWRAPGLVGAALSGIALTRLGFVLISGMRPQPHAA